MNFQKIIFSIFFYCLTSQASSQADVQVRASVDKEKIVIGEQFHLKVEVRIPATQQITPLIIDSIPHFEVLRPAQHAETTTGNEKLISLDVLLTSFDSGHWVIPSFRIADIYLTDTIPVDVVFSDFDPNKDYHDIKDIIEVAPPEKKNWWLYIIAGAVLLLIILLLLFRKKKKPVVVTVQHVVDPYKEAMQQLALLQKTNSPPKIYYTELVDIFRLYIFRKKGVLSLQKTTDDLIIQLKAINLDNEQYTVLAQALRLSDFVKFAKFVPGTEENKNVFETIKGSIDTIEQRK
jgi:LPXTG-motif cell wall-anchored protein